VEGLDVGGEVDVDGDMRFAATSCNILLPLCANGVFFVAGAVVFGMVCFVDVLPLSATTVVLSTIFFNSLRFFACSTGAVLVVRVDIVQARY
jgi:hypothetical protein